MFNKADATTPRLARRFRRLYAGVVYDAMVFDCGLAQERCVVTGIGPLRIGQRPLVGPAATCSGQWGQFDKRRDIVRLKMLEAIHPGDLLVVATGGDENVAHFGDISALLAKQRGAVGALIDGYTRDALALRRDGWPVFCRGTRPQDAFGWWQITEYGEPVELSGDVKVVPRQWVFADDDGVLLIPRAVARVVCEAAEKRAAGERRIRRAVRKHSPEEVYQKFGRW